MPRRLKKTNKKKLRQGRPANVPFVPEKVKIQRTTRDILKGYKALDQLWSKGLKPKDLKFHFYLTWYAYAKGNGTLMAKMCGFHRNVMFYIFKSANGSTNTLRYRVLWEKIKTQYPNKDFFYRYLKFYVLTGGKANLNLSQHTTLTNLWLVGFPFSVLRSHYLLWAVRQRKDSHEIAKMMGKNYRSVLRFKQHALRPGSIDRKWLKPLKSKYEEWYPTRKNWSFFA